MNQAMFHAPTEHDAAAIVTAVLGESVSTIRRFPTGLCHYVYDVTTATQQLVVRIARPDTHGLLAGAVGWSQLLRPLGIPLPKLLYADLEAKSIPFPFIVLERLPGTDLGDVYHTLTRSEKYAIAADVVQLQARMQSLPLGSGFGYTTSLWEPPPHRTWTDVVQQSLRRSRQRIHEVGVVDPALVARVQQQAARFESYLAQVVPAAFLDDTTTKNVIVHKGQLCGIVDVDVVCYGDPLWTIGLTQMALLSQGAELDYTAAWMQQLHCTAEQQQVVQFYTAVFCVDFLSELGRVFNKDRAEPIDQIKLLRLTSIFHNLLHIIGS